MKIRTLTRVLWISCVKYQPLVNHFKSEKHFTAAGIMYTDCYGCHLIWLKLAQPIRLLLEYTGTKYEEKFYSCGEGKWLLL